MTTEPAPGLAHGVGAAAAPKVEFGGPEGPKRAPKRRRPTSPRIPAGVSMEDEVPVVTEWTAGGLPQRRSRVKTPLSVRIAEQAAAERAEREAREARPAWATPAPEPEPEKQDEPEPGLWVEAFWNGLKGTPDPFDTPQPTNEPARVEADDERDHK